MVVRWRGRGFTSRAQFVRHFCDLVRDADRGAHANLELVEELVTQAWPRLTRYDAQVFDFYFKKSSRGRENRLVCSNTHDKSKLVLWKGAFRACYDVLKEEQSA